MKQEDARQLTFDILFDALPVVSDQLDDVPLRVGVAFNVTRQDRRRW